MTGVLGMPELGPCVEWTGKRHWAGYGLRYVAKGNWIRAHRWAWIIEYGRIPKGLFVCHACDNPPCVNPLHLFLGTQKDNHDDMVAKGRARFVPPPPRHIPRRSHCIRGHALEGSNLIIRKSGDHRCRQCEIEWKRGARASGRIDAKGRRRGPTPYSLPLPPSPKDPPRPAAAVVQGSLNL